MKKRTKDLITLIDFHIRHHCPVEDGIDVGLFKEIIQRLMEYDELKESINYERLVRGNDK